MSEWCLSSLGWDWTGMSKRTALSSFCKREELEVSRKLGHGKWRKDILNFAMLWNSNISGLWGFADLSGL